MMQSILRKNMDFCPPSNADNHHNLYSHIDDCSIMSDFDDKIRSDIYKFDSKELQYESFSGMKTFSHMHREGWEGEAACEGAAAARGGGEGAGWGAAAAARGGGRSGGDGPGPALHSPPLLLLQPRDDPLHQVA
jgi:hypothetical protein